MVAFLLDQKHNVHSYLINWPGDPVPLNVLPENLWLNQGHESNGVAGYGFFLGIFGMITAWRMRRAVRSLKSLPLLAFLQLLAALFTFTALVFVFVVTNQTSGQEIHEDVASSSIGSNYPEFKWTPETWMKAVLDLPMADQERHNHIKDNVRNMEAWRCILVLIFIVDVIAFGITLMTWLRQRRNTVVKG